MVTVWCRGCGRNYVVLATILAGKEVVECPVCLGTIRCPRWLLDATAGGQDLQAVVGIASAPRPQRERRRKPRWIIGGPMATRITSVRTAALIDLSLDGAQIEHADGARPGTLAFLTVVFRGRELTLECRVVRSTEFHPEIHPGWEGTPVYRTGLQFLHISEDSRRLLAEYIESLRAKS